MRQPGTASAPTDVPVTSAPWALRGEGWLLPFRLDTAALRAVTHLPTARAAQLEPLPGVGALLVLVDYHASPVGPYHELLVVPGTLPFADGRRHPTIDRIVVSSWPSAVSGRANWGIPKDVASFTWERGTDRSRTDAVEVAVDGRPAARFRLRRGRVHLPAPLAPLPAGARTLAQRWRGSDLLTRLEGTGRIGRGRLLDAWVDPELVPPVTGGRPGQALHVARFELRFPAPHVLPSD